MTLQTEQTYAMREFGGQLFVPFLDPRGFEVDANGYLAVRAPGGAWTLVTTVDPAPAHVFGVAVTADGWWLAGSTESADELSGTGVVWFSSDDGATWTASLSIPGAGAVARVYTLAVFGDELVAFYTDGLTHEAHHWNGATWVDVSGDYTLPVTDCRCPFTIDGTDVWLSFDGDRTLAPVPAANPRIVALPADTAAAATIEAGLPDVQCYDACTDGTSLWLLTDTAEIWRGDTTGTWTLAAVLTINTARSIAVAGGFLYFGTTDSRILRTAIPA